MKIVLFVDKLSVSSSADVEVLKRQPLPAFAVLSETPNMLKISLEFNFF